jgi:hypothetical protein
VTRTTFWLAAISVLLCLSACSAPKDESAQETQPKPKQSLDPESYAKHLDLCLAGGGGCNYDVLTREDRARVLAATEHGKEASKTEGQESSDDGQNR